jgi:ribosomal-protein-alanine N-acetyltransferase
MRRMRTKLRRATVKDVPRMTTLARLGMRGAGWGKRALSEWIVRKSGTALVALDGEVVVGFVLFAADQIVVLVVDPARQRQGHGAALMAETLAKMKKIGWDTAELKVRQGNKLARAFYRALGFKRSGTFGTYLDGETRVVMKRALG